MAQSPLMARANTRVSGHYLINEGAPHDAFGLWTFLYLFIGAIYFVRLLGVAFDGWELDQWQVGFACAFTVFWAIDGFFKENP